MMKQHPDSDRTPHSSAYTPYGYAINAPAEQRLLAFNGQLRDAFTSFYALGNGHRIYNPVLQRFHSADRLSPFDAGGINAYAYCSGDPVNRLDPSGQSWLSPIKGIANLFGRTRSRDRAQAQAQLQPELTPQELQPARQQGAQPPSFAQAESENLLLPNYQYFEDNFPPRIQQGLSKIRERRRIIHADLRYMRIHPDNAPEHMKEELKRLGELSLRLRSRLRSDLTQPVNFSPKYSTAINEISPPAPEPSRIRR
ncbi:TPA: RHS repeat-associated core domain-containing protein [Pseudomonas putida]|jgi:RHS repeat-associated protein|uniref:RHS repeat-associated core domain-containing protein n=1 Tax=Pseudomonas TaxID=286 RepID=UPI00287AB58D|nr:RHS repeat-associated core domain-containing protein [Pseudomonas putida]HDS0970232.1 RHS repeat-associated core domain-containing protein [Pseudomonas putida]HDS1799734.1 RHS repeat-associated core domain-containing protein [Pseudomonas putida]HDS1805665.1 RHS repeat-associated core domain-containing protein [Pseudomonas putida]